MANWESWLFVVEKEFYGNAYSILTNDVLTAAEFDALIEKWERNLCGDWKEITEQEYDDALNILPPRKWYDGGFFCSEAFSGTLHSFYQKLNGKCYTSLQSIYTDRNEIIRSLMEAIAQGIPKSRKEKTT